MVKVNQGHIHVLGSHPKVMMVKPAHLSTFVLLPLPKELLLCILESPPVKQFLVLIRSLLDHDSLPPHLLKDLPFLLRELLQLDVIEPFIIQKLANNDIEIGSWLFMHHWFWCSLGLIKQRKQVVRSLMRGGEVEHREVLVTLTH